MKLYESKYWMRKSCPGWTNGLKVLNNSLVRGCIYALAVTFAMAPGAVFAQTCNGEITIGYTSGPAFALPGDVYTVEASLGAAGITGVPPNSLEVSRVRFQMDCSSDAVLGIPCTSDGDLVSWVNDSTITDNGNCGGTTWSTDGATTTPNEVVFTATPPFLIPQKHDTFSRLCD